MDQPTPTHEFTHHRTVDDSHIDVNGHVNNVVFVQWMQDLAVMHWRAVGGEALQADANGTWFARSHHIEYLKPALLGDEITMRTWVTGARRVRSERRYEFHRDGTLLARGSTDWVFVNLDTGRPMSIPNGFTALFRMEDGDTAPAC